MTGPDSLVYSWESDWLSQSKGPNWAQKKTLVIKYLPDDSLLIRINTFEGGNH